MSWQNAPSGWDQIGTDIKVDYTPEYTGTASNFGFGSTNWSPVSQAASSTDGGYKSKFGEMAGMWNEYMKSKGTGASSGDFSQGSPSAGAAGGHSVTPIGNKGKSFLMQYINPTATVMPGGPGGGGGGGFGVKDAVGLGLAAVSAFCDMRLKTDIAPLESTEVNDALAEVAFFVKGLRECA